MISFPDFFEKAPFAILITEKGRIVKCNPAFQEIFNAVSVSNILNKAITNLINLPVDGKTVKFFSTIKGLKEDIEVEVSRITHQDKNDEAYFVIHPVPCSKGEKNNGKLSAIGREKEELENSQSYLEWIRIAKLAYWKLDIQQGNVELSNEFGLLVGEHWTSNKTMKLKDYIQEYVLPLDKSIVIALSDTAENSKYTQIKNPVEFRLIKKDGDIINVLNILSVKFNKNNVPIICEGVIQDVTSLRKAEAEVRKYQANLEKLIAQRTEELKKSEERLHDALKLGKLTTWEFNFETKKYYGGGEIYEILGSIAHLGPSNAIEVADFEKLIHPDDLPIYYESFQKALKAKDSNYLDYIAYRIIRADGEIRHLYLSIKIEMGENQRFTKLYGTIQDITNFRKIEEEKERLNAIIEITPDIVAVVDPSGALIYLNQSGKFFYGFLGQKNIEDINFFDLQKEETQDLLRNVGFLVASSEGIWTGESELVGKNKQKVPVSIVIVAHFGQEGMINSFSIVIRNISAQKKTEQDLLYKNAELDTFVYRASHDLRGPISSLLGLYQIVQYEIKEAKALEFFEMFNKQILRLNEIILALINLTKIKESSVNKVPIHFTEIVNDAIDSLRHLTEYSNVQFSVKVNVKREFKSDKGMITTIIQNLIENAIKYSKTTKVAPVMILIETHSNTKLKIVVEDKGIGIDKEVQGKIFDMFFRGHEISKGSGLGLYILKNAVEKLKGKITLESQVSVGTTFIIDLPYYY